MSECLIENCNEPVHGRGYCKKHWYSWDRYGDPLITKQLSENPKELSACGNYYTLTTSKEDTFIIDVADYDKISNRVWCLNVQGYVVCQINNKQVKLHRYLIGNPPKDGLVTDHKNRIRTDNRRQNLHWVTYSENTTNKRCDNAKHIIYCEGNKSPRTKPYQVNYRFDGKRYYLGYFRTYAEAEEFLNKSKEENGYYNSYWENLK